MCSFISVWYLLNLLKNFFFYFSLVLITKLIKPKEIVSKKLKLIYASSSYSNKKDFEIIKEVLYNFLVKYKDSVTLSILGGAQVPKDLLSLDNVSNYLLLEYSAILKLILEHDLMLIPLTIP